MSKVAQMSHDQFVSEMVKLKGATIVSIEYFTTADVIKPKTCGLDKLKKICKINGILNFNYANSVNRQRQRENEGKGSGPGFVAQQRKWGKRIGKTPIIVHKDKFYLEVKIERVLSTEYRHEGKYVAFDSIKDHLRSTKPKVGRQGVEKPIVLRDLKLDSIRIVWIKGQEIHLMKGN